MKNGNYGGLHYKGIDYISFACQYVPMGGGEMPKDTSWAPAYNT